MALNNEYLKQRLMIRSIGLTAAMLLGVGIVLAIVGFAAVGYTLIVLAGAPALFVLGYEVKQGLEVLTGQRGSAGTQVVLQILLAGLLLIGINIFSFLHYLRLDWTRDRVFTLPADIRAQLRELQSDKKTIIVVDQRRPAFGRLSDPLRSSDPFEKAARRKIAEKVKDLVEELREFGPQFEVVELGDDDNDINRKLDTLIYPDEESLPRDDLQLAIDAAPENSIFFYSRDPGETKGKIQRLSFNSFYQLDKTASKTDNESWFRITSATIARLQAARLPADIVQGLSPLKGRVFATRDQFVSEVKSAALTNADLEPDVRQRYLEKIVEQADKRDGNLVLRHHARGVPAFTERVLNIDTKRPKAAILVTHELLSTHEQEPYSLKGLGTSLVNNGFDVVDILLKKDLSEPVVYTFDESKFDAFEDELKSLKANVEEIQGALKVIDDYLKKIESDDDTLADALASRQIQNELRRILGGSVSSADVARVRKQLKDEYKKDLKDAPAADRKRALKAARDHLEEERRYYNEDLSKAKRDEEKTTHDRDALNVESATELRRMTDLTAKLKRLLADCDLVILPRFTVHSVIPPFVLRNDFHSLDKAQVDALKSFMADGKPVMACFGPPAEPRPMPMGARPGDGMEDLLSQLGIKLGKQTILFRSEAKSLASAQQEFSVARVSSDVPPVRFDWRRDDADDPVLKRKKDRTSQPPNPIRESMYLAARSVGRDLDLPVRYGRPVFYTGSDRASLEFEPEFMLTDKRSWNEDRPFPMGKAYHPTPPKEDAPQGTLTDKGNGPFTLGVAVEKKVPADWSTSKDADPASVRVAVIGHGGIFAGVVNRKGELDPVNEKLLIDTANWLIGRGDLLAREERPDANRGLWKFPRLEEFSDRKKELWHWGTQLVLPGFFIYLGLVVLMVRHLR
jgi:hypothetical protein